MDATEFIRAFQIREGNKPCFRTKTKCKRLKCAWRVYCLERRPPDDYVEMLHGWMIAEK